MKHLITSSNWRARVAIQAIRIAGREFHLMAELRDALNQRQSMRAQAKFSVWFVNWERRLRDAWRLYCARNPFRFQHGNDENQFNDFVMGEYINHHAGHS